MADAITVSFVGFDLFDAALLASVERADAATRKAVAEGAAEIEKLAKTKSPRVTGDLARSIDTDRLTKYGVAGWQTAVGPTLIYGRRVELGFRGTDRLGRRYNQEGKPYLGPAVEELRGSRLPEIFRRHWAAAIAGTAL